MRKVKMRALVLLVVLWQGAVAVAAGSLPQRLATLTVSGMTCPVCPITVRKALRKLPGVTSVQVDYDNKTAQVQYDPQQVAPDALLKATANAGYPARLAEVHDVTANQ
jgi:mercuric ion binding protein